MASLLTSCSFSLPPPPFTALSARADLTHEMKPIFKPFKPMKKSIVASGASSDRERSSSVSPPKVPVFVMLPLGTMTLDGNDVSHPEELINSLEKLKAIGVEGVMVDTWWGITEPDTPQEYNFKGYRKLFTMIRNTGLKIQAVLSFHECGGNVGDNINIPLPKWVMDIGKTNPGIFFTDRYGRKNAEYLSFGVDEEEVLHNRTPVQAYKQFMLAFKNEFAGFLLDGTICELQIGLGPCGELRFPSYPARNGWVYPGVGEFQCYDKYLIKNLKDAAVVAGKSDWGTGPGDAGTYNSFPDDCPFFHDKRGYDGYYARFFLDWYSGTLLHHADMILASANFVFDAYHISTKVAGIHWHYNHASHAAELTAGYYNIFGRRGYAPIVDVLKKNRTSLNFTCVELATVDKDGEAASDPESLVWQVLNTGWEAGLNVAGENALPCYDRDSYNRIIQNAKRSGIIKHPDGRQLITFTYLRLGPDLMEKANLDEFANFVMKMKEN